MPGLGLLEVSRAFNKLGKLRNLEVDKLNQIFYQDVVQLRAIECGNESLQILACNFEDE